MNLVKTWQSRLTDITQNVHIIDAVGWKEALVWIDYSEGICYCKYTANWRFELFDLFIMHLVTIWQSRQCQIQHKTVHIIDAVGWEEALVWTDYSEGGNAFRPIQCRALSLISILKCDSWFNLYKSN